jgi:hypothetical protein
MVETPNAHEWEHYGFEQFKQEIVHLKESILWHNTIDHHQERAKTQKESHNTQEVIDESLLEKAYGSTKVDTNPKQLQQPNTIPSEAAIQANKKIASENITTFAQSLPENVITRAINSIMQRDTQKS